MVIPIWFAELILFTYTTSPVSHTELIFFCHYKIHIRSITPIIFLVQLLFSFPFLSVFYFVLQSKKSSYLTFLHYSFCNPNHVFILCHSPSFISIISSLSNSCSMLLSVCYPYSLRLLSFQHFLFIFVAACSASSVTVQNLVQ